MKIRVLLFLLSIAAAAVFTFFSYSVAKENWQQIDFDTTVKLQDHVPSRFDRYFSLFGLLGSAEITVALSLFFSLPGLLRRRWPAFFAWLMIFPASLGEVFGKLVLYHPAPPVFLQRSDLPATLPSFYIHTDFSYPSGHMTRTAFLVTVLSLLVFFSNSRLMVKFSMLGLLGAIAVLMALTRIFLGEHWLSDVLGGGLLGMATGLFAAIWVLPTKAQQV